MKKYRNYINNEWINTAKYRDVINPATCEIIASALLNYFDKNRTVDIAEYIHFVEEGVHKTI